MITQSCHEWCIRCSSSPSLSAVRPSPIPVLCSAALSDNFAALMFNVVSQVISNHYLDHEICSFLANDQPMKQK